LTYIAEPTELNAPINEQAIDLVKNKNTLIGDFMTHCNEEKRKVKEVVDQLNILY